MSATTHTGMGAGDPRDASSTDTRAIIRPGRSAPPIFTMPRSWPTDRRLSFAAVGLLARLAEALDDVGDDETVTLQEVLGQDDDITAARALLAEITAAGYVADGEVIDPFEQEWYARQRAEHPEWYAPRQRSPLRVTSVVYYVQRASDGAVKIGHTKDISKRLYALGRDYGPVTLLAAEPGDKHLEDRRHDQFDELRLPPERTVGGTEWFRLGADLSGHIEAIGVPA